MKRLLPIMFAGTLVLGYLAGYASSPAAVVAGQATQAAQPAPQAGALPPGNFSRMSIAPDMGEPYQWSMDDMKKAHTELTARAARNASTPGNPRDLFVPFVSRTHSFIMVHRGPLQPGASAGAEQHEGVSDIYYVVGGSGTVMVGGELESKRVARPGEYLGTSKGGKSFKLKTGDILNIPANMVHATVPDAPEGMTYVLMKVNTGLYPWSLINGTP